MTDRRLKTGEYTIIDGALSSADRQPGASALKIYYNGEPVDQFTMHLGDTVTLTAAYDDGTVPENLIWLSSPETVLQLSYKDGSCEATATQTAERAARSSCSSTRTRSYPARRALRHGVRCALTR